jgi:hypothetical protein
MVDWERIKRLQDELDAEILNTGDNSPKASLERIGVYQAAVRAYRQLATQLRSQGMSEAADHFAYRAQLCQREVLRSQKRRGAWLVSWSLFLLSGYGYRLGSIVRAYGVSLVFFTCIYWFLGVHSFHGEAWFQAMWDSFLVSLSAIHGRTTFEQLGAWSPDAWVAAIESVWGIVIEGVFVAMLVQRFFSR